MTTQFIIIQITPFFKNNSIKSLSEKVDRTNKTVLSVRKTRTSGEGKRDQATYYVSDADKFQSVG